MVVPVVVGMVRRGEFGPLQRTHRVQVRAVVIVTVDKELRTAECAYCDHRGQDDNCQPAHHIRPHEPSERGQGVGVVGSAHGRRSVSGSMESV